MEGPLNVGSLQKPEEVITPGKHAIKGGDRFLGNPRIDIVRAQGDVISYLLADAPEALLTLDGTDPRDGVHQILSVNWRAHGRAIPLGWVTARKDS